MIRRQGFDSRHRAQASPATANAKGRGEGVGAVSSDVNGRNVLRLAMHGGEAPHVLESLKFSIEFFLEI